MSTVRVVAANGKTWLLKGEKGSPVGGVFIEQGGTPDLFGKRNENTVQLVGRDGGRARPGVFNPISGSFNLVFREFGGDSCGQVLREWMRGWGQPVTLRVTTAQSSYWAVARWPGDKDMTAWDVDPDSVSATRMQWPFVIDGGLWFSNQSSPGPKVTVTNSGDSLVCPSITWRGGGTVTIEGGPSFTLPSVSAQRRVLLDVNENFMVIDPLTGERDVPLWNQIKGSIFSMPIRPGQSQTLTVPGSDSVVEWSLGERNPWL